MTSFIDNTYAYEGTDAVDWYSKAILGAPTLELIKTHPGVKNSTNVPNLNISRSIGPDSASWTNTGDITVGTKKLTVTTVSIKKEIEEQDLEAIFLSASINPGSTNEDFVPADFVRMVLDREAKNVNKEVEEMIWIGDTVGGLNNHLDEIDGYRKQMLADAAIIDVTGTTLTSANISAELSKVVNAIPKVMLRSRKEEKVGIGISLNAERAYRKDLTNKHPGMYTNSTIEDGLTYDGWKLFVLDGLPDNTMVFADFNNLWFGTDLFDDKQDIKVIPLKDTIGEDKIRIKGRFKLGVAYGNSDEIVLYDPSA